MKEKTIWDKVKSKTIIYWWKITNPRIKPQVLQAPPQTIEVLLYKCRGENIIFHCISENSIVETGAIWIAVDKHRSGIYPLHAIIVL